MFLLPSLLLALPLGNADLTRAIELVRAGREFDALQVLEGLEPSNETRFWTLRARASVGQVAAVLEATDGGDLSPADADYLRGIAFHRQALDSIANGQGGLVDFQFRDSAALLAGAVELDAARYADAFCPLSEALWYTQRLTDARRAGEQAVLRTASNPRSHFLLGEVCFSQFVTARADEAKAEEAKAHRTAADGAFRGVLGAVDGKLTGHATIGAKAASKLGDLAVWVEEPERAAGEYAVAVSWSPSQVNYAQVMDSIGSRGLVTCLKKGCAAFEERYGVRDVSEATPLWWLGYAQFSEKEYADADKTFERVLKLFPAYTNSWWYRAEARFHLSDVDGFLECIRSLDDHGMDVLAGQVQTNFTHNSSVLTGALEMLSKAGRLRDAAYLCEVRVAADPKNWEVWDNLGLFSRDAGESMVGRAGTRQRGTEAEREEAKRLFLRASEAYERAYVLDSTKPHLLNDRAVILDYYLDSEHQLATSLYERALAQSKELLADPDALGDFERTLAETAGRDSANNLERLKRRLERERKKREREEAKKKKREGEDGTG